MTFGCACLVFIRHQKLTRAPVMSHGPCCTPLFARSLIGLVTAFLDYFRFTIPTREFFNLNHVDSGHAHS